MKSGKQAHIILLAITVGQIHQVSARDMDKMIMSLVAGGFENIAMVQEEKRLTLTFENPVYRWDVAALISVLDMAATHTEPDVLLEIILLNKGIPQVLVSVRSDIWRQFRDNSTDYLNDPGHLFVSENTHEAWQRVRHEKVIRPHVYKTDLVLYPQFSFENTLLNKLYEIQLNIAPAVRFSLWRGMNFSAQLVIPLVNELGYEGNHIRPGQLVISQSFSHQQLSGRLSFGKFSANRWGTDLALRYLLPDPDWSLKLHTGLTGSAHYYDKQGIYSELNTLTYSLGATWFVSDYNMEMEGGIRKYIYGDAGMYSSVTRWFGETAVGFYAQASDVDVNGGFHLTVPFPVKKRNRKHLFRVTIPNYQDMVYNAGTELYYGQTYQAGNESETTKRFYRASYMKNQILRKLTIE